MMHGQTQILKVLLICKYASFGLSMSASM